METPLSDRQLLQFSAFVMAKMQDGEPTTAATWEEAIAWGADRLTSHQCHALISKVNRTMIGAAAGTGSAGTITPEGNVTGVRLGQQYVQVEGTPPNATILRVYTFMGTVGTAIGWI